MSRTFSLWQDTWYFDRKQRNIEDLQYFIANRPEGINIIEEQTSQLSFKLSRYQANGHYNVKNLPMVIRNGLAINYLLGHVLSTMEYGCRGPVDGTVNGVFGANTFHIEPEDILVGG